MEWKNFEESKIELPEVVVEKMIEGFSTATKNLVKLGVSPMSELARLNNVSKLKTRFQFKVTLFSDNLSDYSFTVFQFGYNIKLYPVDVYIARSIIEEIGTQQNDIFPVGVSSFEDETKFKKAMELIFSSKRFTETVSGLMKIAQKNNSLF